MRMWSTAVAGWLVSATMVFAAPEVLPPTAPTMLELQKIEAAGHHPGAVDPLRLKYQETARARPGDAMPRVFVAWCTLPSDDAWNQLKAISVIFPDNPWVRYGMGRIYTGWKGMSDLAKTEFETALKRDPKFFPAIIGLGDVARVKQDYATAEQRYREALAIADDPFARSGLGLTLAAAGKNEEARAELRKAIALMPEQPAALSTLVKLSVEANDPKTVEAAQALAELRPRDRAARRMLADLRFDLGEKKVAAVEYERLVRLGNPELDVLNRLAGLYRELSEAEGEERTLQIIAALDDKNPAPNLRLGELRLAKQDFEGAEGQWLEALARDPKKADAHEAIAKMQRERGLLHEALVQYRKAAALDPSRTDSAAQAAKLEADFKLPKKKAKGNPNNIYWAVQASLGTFFEERKVEKPALSGKYRLRVRVTKDGAVDGVDVLEDTLQDPLLLGHVYFGLLDAEYPKQKTEPVFEFELGGKKKGSKPSGATTLGDKQ